MIGKQIHHYKIIEKIGAGGMGEVFLAEDTKLDRKVALKFLPERFSSDPEFKSRFEHEAKAAAALEHPNIVTVYELGEHEGKLFIAMQRVSGSTLAELIDTNSISIRKALSIGLQLCEGLAAAHQAGIVHRDIKPANILIDESDRVHILDFGLAKSRKATTETKVGSTLGTVQYESPEQSRGEVVDHRSDLFSLGVVMYEMVTGKLPFTGEYDESIRYAISHETAEPLARYKSDVPAGLEELITKLMEKETEMRYQSAEGVTADLKRIQRDLTQQTPAVSRIVPAQSGDASAYASATPVDEKSGSKKFVLPTAIVVVLIALALVFKPWKFEVAPTQEAHAVENRLAIMYFDNLADPSDSLRHGEIVASLLIADIAASTELKVVSTQRLYDILKLLGKEGARTVGPDVASQVAEKSNSRWMLTGNILRIEPNVVLTAQLVEVATGNVLTSSRVDGAEGEDIFSMVDKLTAGITEHLNVPASTMNESPNVSDLTTTSAEAYRYYLEGRDLQNRYKRYEAREAFEKSIALDSNFAMSYFWLSIENNAREMIAKAMELRDRVGEMDRLTIESRSAYVNRDYESAFEILDQLIEKYPDEKFPYQRKSRLHRTTLFREYKESIALLEKVIEIDPLDKDAYNSLAYDYERINQFDKSLWAINKYIELAPDEPSL
ncbi:protein kinase [bacterium AH-315-F03]|nr:protein kinase [bacterium AH-315-F03]